MEVFGTCAAEIDVQETEKTVKHTVSMVPAQFGVKRYFTDSRYVSGDLDMKNSKHIEEKPRTPNLLWQQFSKQNVAS